MYHFDGYIISGILDGRVMMSIKLPSHKTKIVCTIGPASRTEKVLKGLIRAGMNIARLNLSHGSLDQHARDIRLTRRLSDESGRPVAILVDLPGPKIRVGMLNKEPMVLKKGDNVTLTVRNLTGDTSLIIPVEFKGLIKSLKTGGKVYLNDGFIQLRVLEIKGDDAVCRVVIGGKLLSHKGLNVPGADLGVDAVTERDLELLDFALKNNVDAVGVSFAGSAEDINMARDFALAKGKDIYVVAKIERSQAVENIDGILEASDAIMVARGDLGVEIPIEKVPVVQKMIIRKANVMGKPVITATQMLESMTSNIRPTRAEVTDVANAILDGTDAVMLSEETAIGDYPVETVRMMSKIASVSEKNRIQRQVLKVVQGYKKSGLSATSIEDVISSSLIDALNILDIRLILTPTHSGSTPRLVSRFKPRCWIISFSENMAVCNFLSLSYGVYPVFMERRKNILDKAIQFIEKNGLAKKGDTVILTEGLLPGRPGGTDTFRIIRVD